ncbi:oxidoreductase [Vulcanimicrobium alpinum]|uniref:Oxidoreductase n=1 Tax=Vulcanimicrobium alpinum TaxID=3016050 RepID=A0AAN2CB52_UNVUL|nr:aldo/keto reductase [Vulcanimicrobium alpinum]BDE07856.1 oxidoreductase [Vulcanimicrobium alpinum]
MIARRLGRSGPQAGAIALGCMGMSEFYDAVADADAIATIHRALDLGMTLIDTSDMYGLGENERLVGRALRDRRERAVLATKTGIVRRSDDPAYRGVNGRPEYVRDACTASLRRLGVDAIDLYYLHRVDPAVPIEETVGAMAELVDAGHVRHLGLSEVPPDLLRRAAAVAPIAALQSEYSLFTRDVETNGVLAEARELGIALVAYAPLGRGMLTAAMRSTDALGAHDLRRRVPRFDPGNFERNLARVDRLATLAASLHCTPAQLGLGWVLARGSDVFALPGSERVAHVEENARAADVAIDARGLALLDDLFPPGAAAGARIRPAG